jgi:hypothetical protein
VRTSRERAKAENLESLSELRHVLQIVRLMLFLAAFRDRCSSQPQIHSFEPGGKVNDLRFPIGRFAYSGPPDEQQRHELIEDIERAPAALREAVQGLAVDQIETPYRDGGWTVRQVIHHLPESHMNAYIRFKLALTEDEPTIKPYMEDRWAELPDVRSTPIEVSLALLDALHRRWVSVLREIGPAQWKREFHHPQLGRLPLEKNLALYSWHGKHHVAHINALRQRLGW